MCIIKVSNRNKVANSETKVESFVNQSWLGLKNSKVVTNAEDNEQVPGGPLMYLSLLAS